MESNLLTRETTAEELATAYRGASGSEWMDLRIEADRIGRIDLVEFCIDMAEQAYSLED